MAVFGYQLQPPGCNVIPELVERLPHIAQTLVGAAGRHVGVEADHWNAGSESIGCRRVERRGVNKAHSDTVCLSGNSSLHRVDHLGHDAVLGTGPLVAASKKGAGILDTINRGCEELVGCYMINENKFVA